MVGRAFALCALAACSGNPTAPQARAPDTIGLYSPVGNYFALLPAGTESDRDLRFQTGFSTSMFFVLPTPIHGNFDGAGKDTVGFYDPRENRFFLRFDNSASPTGDLDFRFGDVAISSLSPFNPVGLAGDWSGSGRDTVGFYDPATSTFHLSSANAAGAIDTAVQFGTAERFVPMTGDWTGSGRDTIGLYDPGTGEVRLRTTNTPGDPDVVFAIDAGMFPVAGDWDGDGIDTIGLLDHANNVLHIRNTNAAGPADEVLKLERTTWTWLPIAGNWRPSSAPPVSNGFDWPTATPESQGLDPAKVEAAYAAASALPFTESIVIIRHGYLVREGYFHGNRPAMAHQIASSTKSVLSSLFGIAFGDGKFTTIATPISQLLPAQYYPNQLDANHTITLGAIMTMSSGLNGEGEIPHADWDHIVSKSDNMLAEMMARPPSYPMGTFAYNSINPQIGEHILNQMVGPVATFAEERLAKPLGIELVWWPHEGGNPDHIYGAGELAMKPRDMARFGQLYLNRGLIDGHQIVPANWVDGSTAALVTPNLRFGQRYGLWWWHLAASGPTSDMYAAIGTGGQYIIVIPSADAVVVLTNKSEVQGAEAESQYDAIDRLLVNQIIPIFY